MMIWPSLFDDECRRLILTRLRSLAPGAQRRWGRKSAPEMLVHLTDQMQHALGDRAVQARPGKLRWPLVRYASISLLPWPKGRIKGPPEAFVTRPKSWEEDVAELEALLRSFAARDPRSDWRSTPSLAS